jgi:hypothetical protein
MTSSSPRTTKNPQPHGWGFFHDLRRGIDKPETRPVYQSPDAHLVVVSLREGLEVQLTSTVLIQKG